MEWSPPLSCCCCYLLYLARRMWRSTGCGHTHLPLPRPQLTGGQESEQLYLSLVELETNLRKV